MKTKIEAKSAPIENGAYSNAIRVGNMIFISGQLPIDPATGKIPAGIQAQTRQAIANIRHILADAGASLDDVVKSTVMITEMMLFSEMNEVYAQEFNPPYPARSAMGVRELPQGALLELDVTAVIAH